MNSARNDDRSKKKFKPVYWLVFLVAIISISELFGGHKYLDGASSIKALIMIPTTMMVFLACMFYLSYQVYAEEKERDNLKVSFAPFEYIYKKWGTKNG